LTATIMRRACHLVTVALVLSLCSGLAAQSHSQKRHAQPPDTFSKLLSGNGRALISQPATLSNVTIQDITQNDIVWVGSDAARSVMVLLQPSVNPIDPQGNPTPIAAGDSVRVTGHVIAAPSTQLLQNWGVSAAEAARVQRQGVALQAVTFEITHKNR